MAKKAYEENKIFAIAEKIREKTGANKTYTTAEMPVGVEEVYNAGYEEAVPESALTITGIASNRFAYNGWDWFLKKFSDKLKTEGILDGSYMFYQCSLIEEIPFDLNFKKFAQISQARTITNIFGNCSRLTKIPKLNNCQPSGTSYMFNGCYRLRSIDPRAVAGIDWTVIDGYTSGGHLGSRTYMFSNCYSLRSFPMDFLNHGNPYTNSGNYCIYYYLFQNCYALDEIVGLPNPHYNATITSNLFVNTFSYCERLKRMTFDTHEDGAPMVVNWKNQTISLFDYVGFTSQTSRITGYNSGITEDKRIKDDETYQALKDDPDAFATGIYYSRYNHDSAVETINSLPDASAYLATVGGTNTIKFSKNSGRDTDGGAIDNLTAEEIAVAAAKGWTVSLT